MPCASHLFNIIILDYSIIHWQLSSNAGVIHVNCFTINWIIGRLTNEKVDWVLLIPARARWVPFFCCTHCLLWLVPFSNASDFISLNWQLKRKSKMSSGDMISYFYREICVIMVMVVGGYDAHNASNSNKTQNGWEKRIFLIARIERCESELWFAVFSAAATSCFLWHVDPSEISAQMDWTQMIDQNKKVWTQNKKSHILVTSWF